MNTRLLYLGGIMLLVFSAGLAVLAQPDDSPDVLLRAALADHDVHPLADLPDPDPAQFALGEALFFDPILSGSGDIACATCHHPLLASTDGLSLGLGTGNTGLGPERFHVPGRPFIARHAPDLFNRGQPEWRVMFWDGRVVLNTDNHFDTPAGADLPDGLDSPLAAQAMFPVSAAAEMRGFPGDKDVTGRDNRLALLDTPSLEPDFAAIWDTLTARILQVPAYEALFSAAYPETPPDAFGFQHAANALAAYESAVFDLHDSPFDRYLDGDDSALEAPAKRGALLFFGKAGCARCHTGPLLTDQAFHNVGIPQLGPGMSESAPLDPGRGHETGQAADRFAFRTPPLRNVALTAPYMHNGAYTTLEAAVRHMAAPASSLQTYNPDQLIPELAANVWNDPPTTAALLAALDPRAGAEQRLSPAEVADLVAFLYALTDPAAADLGHLVPDAVPSGLTVAGN